MKKLNIYFADLETATPNTEYFKKYEDTKINIGYIESFKDDNDNLHFISINELINWFYLKSRSAIIYFHNLSWDGDFILKALAKSKKYKCVNFDSWKNLNNGEYCFMRQLNKIYSIILVFNGKKKNKIYLEFKCSLNILGASVESLGQSIGIAKYENITPEEIATFYDVEPKDNIKEYPKKYIEYVTRDVKIVKKSFEIFKKEIDEFINNSKYKNVLQKFNWFKKYTAGSIAYNIQYKYITKFSEIKEGFKCSRDTYELAQKFYFGGFTEFNPHIQNKVVECKNGLGIDINSAHPHSMTQLLPYGELVNFRAYKPDKGKKYLEYWEIKIDVVMAKYKNVPCFYNWNKKQDRSLNRYVLSTQNVTCYYLKEEFETLKKYYHFEGVKIINKYWAYASNFLKKYVDDLYKLKQYHSQHNQKALANVYKLLLNSSYGKHATRLFFSEYYICKNKEEYDNLLGIGNFYYNKNEYEITDAQEVVKLKDVYILKITPTKEKDKNYHKLIAATITAYTRINILETILKLNPDNFLYCDTDSIYLKDYNKDDLQPLLHDNKLGKWKIEKHFRKFIVAGAKCYAVLNEDESAQMSKYSGINKRWLKDNWDLNLWKNQDIVLLKANLKKQSCRSGLILVNVDYQPTKRHY